MQLRRRLFPEAAALARPPATTTIPKPKMKNRQTLHRPPTPRTQLHSTDMHTLGPSAVDTEGGGGGFHVTPWAGLRSSTRELESAPALPLDAKLSCLRSRLVGFGEAASLLLLAAAHAADDAAHGSKDHPDDDGEEDPEAEAGSRDHIIFKGAAAAARGIA